MSTARALEKKGTPLSSLEVNSVSRALSTHTNDRLQIFGLSQRFSAEDVSVPDHNKRFHLSDLIFNALLLQVDPAREEETIKEIRSKFGQKALVFIGFGKYDLIVVTQEPDFDLIKKFHEKGLQHVQDWFPVWGLRWEAKQETARELSEDYAIGLSFIKIDNDYIVSTGKSPIEREEEIIKLITKNVPCIVVSSLGFNEILLVIQANSLKSLSEQLIAAKKCLIDAEGNSIILDISTIPAIGCASLEKNEIIQKENVNVFVLLALRLGVTVSFRKKLEEIAGSHYSIFGFHDVLININGPTNDVIKKLWSIRENGKQSGLHSTFTIIPHPDEALAFKIPVIPTVQKPVTESSYNLDDQIGFYRTWFRASSNDPLTKQIFEDQFPFFSNEKKIINDLQPNDLDKIENFFATQALDNLRECLRIGFEQRSSGITPGNLLGPKSIRTEPLGSIQRATIAIESIPRFLFDKLGLGPWNGFCVYGYASRFYCTKAGIINIPNKFRLAPEMWFGVFHETGHAAFSLIDPNIKEEILDEIEQLTDNIIRRNNELFLAEIILEEDYMRFVDEIFAELFGFHFGFRDDWKLYIRKLWGYFSDEIKLDYKHLSRSVLAYFTFGPGKTKTKDQIDLKEIDKCIDQIEEITLERNDRSFDSEDRDATVSIVLTFLNTADVLKTFLLQKPSLFDKEEITRIRRAIKKGNVVNCSNPLNVFLSLLTMSERLQVKNQFAAILSMYNCYYMIKPKMLGNK